MGERNNPWLKRIDYYLGCPLVYCLGLFRKKNKDIPSIISRVLLIKTAGIGDTVLVGAMVEEIKHWYPKCTVDIICSKNNESMAKILSGVSLVHVFDMRKPVESLRLINQLEKYDILFDFAPWPRINALISYVANASFKVGFKRKKMYRHYIYDVAVPHSDSMHEINNYRNLLKAANITLSGIKPSLPIDEKKERITQQEYVVFHLYPGGAMQKQRMWADENWISLAEYIASRYHMKIIFSGGKEDRDRAEIITDRLNAKGISANSIAGKYPLKDIPTVLAQAKLLISVNTGIMHIGAAAGVPVIALHGATSEKRWGPLSDRAVVVKSGESCQPCISLGFESKCENPICMTNISVKNMIKVVDEMLEEK